MHSIGEKRRWSIARSAVNVALLVEPLNLDQGDTRNNSFRVLIKNEGQAAATIIPVMTNTTLALAGAATTWTQCNTPGAIAATVTVAPGAERMMEFVGANDSTFLNFLGQADLTAITLPAGPGPGYAAPGGTVVPVVIGGLLLSSLDHAEPVGVAP